ncbi:MAG: ATP-binding protein [Planctomycetia bacterium]
MPHPEPVPESRTPPPAALPDAALLWKALTDSIDCFVNVIDTDLRLRFLNRSDVGHAQAADLIGRPITDFVVPEMREAVQRTLREVFATGRDAAYEVAAIDAAGRTTSYSARASAVVDGGAVVAVVITSMDSRLLHETERALRAERHALQQMLRTQERERQLVSYEIHDGLAQYQAGAIMQLEGCLHSLQAAQDARLGERDARLEDVVESCAEGLRLMRAAAAEARRLINGLRPPMLDELGIEEAVESLIERMHGVVPAIEYLHPEPLRRMDPDVETAIFRIAQESLSNVRKHAGARHVRVVLEPRGTEEVAVSVSDDGVGFDVNGVPADRFGLEGIRQRARLFGREAEITSAPGAGTRIEVVLPLFPAISRTDSRG